MSSWRQSSRFTMLARPLSDPGNCADLTGLRRVRLEGRMASRLVGVLLLFTVTSTSVGRESSSTCLHLWPLRTLQAFRELFELHYHSTLAAWRSSGLHLALDRAVAVKLQIHHPSIGSNGVTHCSPILRRLAEIRGRSL